MAAKSRVAVSLAFGALLAAAPARAVSFQYVLARDGKTSAGVFAADGTLVRTLWSGAATTAGTHAAEWDGTRDDGKPAASGRYQVRVLSSQAAYTWEGVVGNTSDSWTGPGVFHFMSTVSGMAIAGGAAFIAAGYNEAATAQARFAIAATGKKTPILGKGAEFWKVATDGTRVYWAGDDPNGEPPNGFVMATAVADDQQISFDARFGPPLATRYGISYQSAVDVVRAAGARPTGVAVQRRHPYLFVARAEMNALHVLDKTSGRLVRSYRFEAPGDLTVDAGDDLWLIHTVRRARTVQRMAVAADGTLQPGVTLAGLDDPRALAGGALLLVADAGASQQVKAFTLAGASAWTLGQVGGYARDPEVRDDRLDLTPNLEGTQGGPFLALEPDGSFWVGDTGCYRLLRFSPARALIDRISYIPFFYSAAADPVAPTRVFANFLEFAVDYGLPLGPRNGSWRLVRNWRAGAPSGFASQYTRMKYATTLPNGRAYACLGSRLFELPARGPLRDTRTSLPGGGSLYADGSVRAVSLSGETETWTEYPLADFDTDGNPRWGPPKVLAHVDLDVRDPHDAADGNVLRAGVLTSGGVLVSYDFAVPLGDSPVHGGWHLGGVRVGGDRWLWRASRSAPRNYVGDWPADGTFNIRNGVGNAGGAVMASGRHIFYGYRGEGWRGQQTNKYRHYLDDGLLVGEFGVVYEETHHLEAAAQMAGNAFNDWLVGLPDGRVYLYHNDESYHGGLHRWRLDGLDTVVEQRIGLAWKSRRGPAAAGAPERSSARARTWDLLAGLPADAVVASDQHGWTITPAPEDGWLVRTNEQTWQTDPPVDIGATFSQKTPAAHATLARELPSSRLPLKKWDLRTRITYVNNYINHGEQGGQYLEVLDAADKVIARFYPVMIAYPTEARIYGNRTVIKQMRLPDLQDEIMGWWQPLRIGAEDGRITFAYAGLPPVSTPVFDPTADWQRPRRLRLTFWYAGEPYRRTCHLDDLTWSAQP